MSGLGGDRQLGGLARTIDALFERAGEAAGATAEVVPQEANPGAGASARALLLAVDLLGSAEGGEAAGYAERISTMGAALEASGDLDGVVDAVERLVGEGGDPLREPASSVARRLLTPSVARRWVERMGAEREEARRAGVVALFRRLGPVMASPLSEALAETDDRGARRGYHDALVALEGGGASVVETMLEDPRWYVVRNGVAILGDVGGARAVELVIGALASSDARVRKEALHALAKLGGEDAGQLACGMLEDPDADVRSAAALACGELRVERALKPLIRMAEKEQDADLLVNVLRALGRIGDPGAVGSIERHAVGGLFSKPPTPLRIAAYRALHRIGTPHARRLLNQAVDDRDVEVRSEVRQLFGMA